MYTDITSCVTNNGYSTEFFDLKRGIRQGCPLSALLFILAVEILAIKIRHSSNIKGVQINTKEIKLTQLADDTTLFLKDISSLQHSFELINKFHTCSGLKLNYTKTEILPLGKFNFTNIPAKIVKSACSLGIWYFNNINDIISENYKLKSEEIEIALNKWKQRKLTVLGKATVVKTLIVPKINHVIANISTPQWFVEHLQQKLFAFLWDDKPPKVKNTTMLNTPEKGGLKFPDIDTMVKSQKLSWIKRMIENKDAAWMQLLYNFLPDMSIKHILKCSIDPRRLAEYIPDFYRQILYAWFDLNTDPTTGLDIKRQIIWLNKHITIKNKPIYNRKLYQKGVISINDLIGNDRNFYTYEEFTALYGIPVNRLYYMGIIDAIPKEWKKQLKTCYIPNFLINNDEDPHIEINQHQINITQVKSRDMYIKLQSFKEQEPTCIQSWNQRLNAQITPDDWAYIFTLPKLTVCDTKVIELQFKILHRFYATNSIISKWDETKNANCRVCKQKANILHNFVTCTEVHAFWEQLTQEFIKLNIDNTRHISNEDILFGRYIQAKYDLFNHAVMYAKYYIHKQFVADKPLSTRNFIELYRHILIIERERYVAKDKLKEFNQRFARTNLVNVS